MESTIYALNAELEDVKKISEEDQTLVSLGAQLSKLKSINKNPSSLADNKFYAMAQAVLPKTSPESISLGGGLIVGGLLASIGINDNNIISVIPNYIPSPSNLRYVVNKYRNAAFMRMVGFIYNYPCSVLCVKEERSGIGRHVKYIDFCIVNECNKFGLNQMHPKGAEKN